MMYYRGPSRILWFAVGAFAATCYHRVNPPREFRGWGPCGNRRIEEWRAERAAMKEQSPPQATSQPKQNETAAEWSWKPNVSQSFEDEEIRRKWEEKTKEAQGKVADLSESALDGIVVAAESLKAKLAEFRQSQQPEQGRRTPPPEDSTPRRIV